MGWIAFSATGAPEVGIGIRLIAMTSADLDDQKVTWVGTELPDALDVLDRKRRVADVYYKTPGRKEITASAGPSKQTAFLQIKPERQPSPAPAERPALALTFDDGPHRKWTPKLLDLLERLDVRATFFMIGQQVQAFPALAKRARDGGHSVQNHTWSHPRNLKVASDAELAAELKRASDAIENAVGRRPVCLRPPYGLTDRRVASAAKSQGMGIQLWTIDTLDWRAGATADTITAAVTKGLAPEAVSLMHDGGGPRAKTISAVERVITQIRADGKYRFEKLCPRETG
jgi:peptidoglycan/xylan/chitin deacetylase (PgdA/CDA1 family)